MADVFISYAQADRKRGDAIAAALESEGYSVARASGVPAPEQRALIAQCRAVIACWSRAGVKADRVFAAAAQSYNQRKLIAVLLQPVEPPAPYDQVEAIDLSPWRGETDDPGWRGVIGAVHALAPVREDRTAVQAAAPAPAPAPVKPANLFQPRAPSTPAKARDDAGAAAPNRLALIALTAMALIVAGLWAAPRVIEALNADHASVREREEIAAAALGDRSSEPADAVDPRAPGAPPASSPVAEISAPVVTPVGGTAKAAPAEPEARAPNAILADLEQCLGALAALCPTQEPGFMPDARISAGERRMLSTAVFPDRGLVTGDNLTACLAAKAKPQTSPAKVCPSAPPKPEAPPAPKADALDSGAAVAAPPL